MAKLTLSLEYNIMWFLNNLIVCKTNLKFVSPLMFFSGVEVSEQFYNFFFRVFTIMAPNKQLDKGSRQDALWQQR